MSGSHNYLSPQHLPFQHLPHQLLQSQHLLSQHLSPQCLIPNTCHHAMSTLAIDTCVTVYVAGDVCGCCVKQHSDTLQWWTTRTRVTAFGTAGKTTATFRLRRKHPKLSWRSREYCSQSSSPGALITPT